MKAALVRLLLFLLILVLFYFIAGDPGIKQFLLSYIIAWILEPLFVERV